MMTMMTIDDLLSQLNDLSLKLDTAPDDAAKFYLQILILDNGNFTPIASLPFDSGIDGGTVNGFSDLVYLGDDGVAFLSPSYSGLGKLYILRSPVIATPP